MKVKTTNVVILGATGMLGRVIYQYLSKKYENVYGTSRKPDNGLIHLDAESSVRKMDKLFEKIKPKYVVNCIGILRSEKKQNLKAINSNFPKIISKISEDQNFNIVNISTDAVFSDLQREVDEDSIPAPNDGYGKSKMTGEQKLNTLNIRTSIIGHDPNKHNGILEFLIKNKKHPITGFINQKWSGSTTLQLAKFIEDLIYNKNLKKIIRKTNVIHFAPIKSNKYFIVKAFSSLLGGKKPRKTPGKEINRVLKSKYINEKKLKRYGTSIKKALRELMVYDQNYVKTYKNN